MNGWVFLVVFGASLLKGITGFGFSLVSLPLLLYWFDAKELIPILMLCNLLSSLVIVLQKKERKLVSREYRLLIGFGGVFTLLGIALLVNLSEDQLLFVLGIFFILLSLLSLGKVKHVVTFSPVVYSIFGAIIGFLTGTISVSGPPLALFMRKTGIRNDEFREVFAWFSVVTAVVCMIGYYHVGLATLDTLKYSAFFLPVLFIGMYIGKRLNRWLPSVVFQQICVVITIVSSIFLVMHGV